MQLTHIICDHCGNEITDANKPEIDIDGDYLPVNIETKKGTAMLSIQIFTSCGLNLDFCKNCIIAAFAKLSDQSSK